MIGAGAGGRHTDECERERVLESEREKENEMIVTELTPVSEAYNVALIQSLMQLQTSTDGSQAASMKPSSVFVKSHLGEARLVATRQPMPTDGGWMEVTGHPRRVMARNVTPAGVAAAAARHPQPLPTPMHVKRFDAAPYDDGLLSVESLDMSINFPDIADRTSRRASQAEVCRQARWLLVVGVNADICLLTDFEAASILEVFFLKTTIQPPPCVFTLLRVVVWGDSEQITGGGIAPASSTSAISDSPSASASSSTSAVSDCPSASSSTSDTDSVPASFPFMPAEEVCCRREYCIVPASNVARYREFVQHHRLHHHPPPSILSPCLSKQFEWLFRSPASASALLVCRIAQGETVFADCERSFVEFVLGGERETAIATQTDDITELRFDRFALLAGRRDFFAGSSLQKAEGELALRLEAALCGQKRQGVID